MRICNIPMADRVVSPYIQERKLLADSPQTSEKMRLLRGRTEASAPTNARLKAVRPIDFYTSNMVCSTMFLFVEILRPARRAFLNGRANDEWHAESTRFFGASALFSRPASLFCILFSDKPEKSMPAERCTNAILPDTPHTFSARPPPFFLHPQSPNGRP